MALDEAAALGSDLAARAATRRQLRLVCAAQDLDAAAVLAPLAPPSAIHYTGHRIVLGDDRGFAQRDERRIAAEIAAGLERHAVGFGYGALASGADILFAEALLARPAELHVVLPFDREEFIAVSVAPAGEGWLGRYHAALDRAHSVTMATDDRYLGHDELFAFASQIAMGLAALRARYVDGPVRQLAVWNRRPASPAPRQMSRCGGGSAAKLT